MFLRQNSATEADPTLLAATHHPPPNAVGRGSDTLGHNSNPHLGYNRAAYPYGLSPNYMPPVMQDDTGHISSPILEGESPRQPDEVHEDHHEYAQRDVEFYPPIPVEEPAPNTLPRPTLTAPPIILSTEGPPPAPQVPTPTTTRPADNPNAMRSFPPRPIQEFTPLLMTCEDLLPSLIANQLVVITPRKIFQPPFPKWYDPNATCKYHGNTPGHSIEKCLAFKYKVQHLIDVGWLTFQEDRPNVKTNPLANHGGGAVNAIESDRLRRSKPLKDVETPRRLILEAPQKGGVIPHGGHKEDSCLLHPGELHNMETCLAVEELLQRMIDKGQLEVGNEGREEQHICMQSVDETSFGRPKPLVIYFTKGAASQKPRHPSASKPVPFPYRNSHAVPWRYTPPNKKEEEATNISLLSAKVSNIMGLSGVTRSGRVFASPDLPIQPTNVKGKAKVEGLPEKRDVSMGTNQTGKRFYQVKVKSLDTTSIKELGRLMKPLQMQAFRKTYGKILELTIAEVSIEAIASLTQYYDQPLRCFTFGDFQLVPTIEEFEEILGCPLGGRKLYLSSGCLPSLSRIATVVKDSARGLDRIKQTRNGIAGLPWGYLEDKARGMANQGDWVPLMDVLALLIFGVVLFPNVDGLVDLAGIDAFLAYHHSKESPVVAVLADLFDTFDRRCEKSSARIICCLPALCVWLVSHLFQQDTRHPCPLLSHRSCTEKRRIDWDQLLAGIGGRTISWFPRWKEGKEGVLFSCGGYPNIPLVGTRGCINYNPALAIRQLGYPMRGAPTEERMSPFLVRDFGAQNFKAIQRIHKAWETPLRKDQELRGIRNGIIGGYHEWLKVHIRGLDWLAKLKVVSEESFEAPEEDEEVQALKSELGKAKLAKEKFKLAATHIRKECAGLREENAITARALEQETKRARKEEYRWNKFRGALWGSNSELKLQREERDQSRAHSMVLKEELVACSRSKRSLSQRLCETETNMLAIIAKYQEELGLATAHEQRITDEYAQVYAEKEARGRVIDSLHQEATMWMDRFALTLNGSQELPRLLAKAKAMADTYSTPKRFMGFSAIVSI
ncbi:hypothetical protein GmHk_04G010639 [Glycine max]|nr:hypothetical protein GmHk_04G010639 [Glycine max]